MAIPRGRFHDVAQQADLGRVIGGRDCREVHRQGHPVTKVHT
jgi:hypothetical protein